MANTDRVNGARPVRHLNGSAWNGATERMCMLAATGANTMVGDFVVLGGDADADGVADVIRASAGGDLLGVITSFEVDGSDLETPYRTASTLRYCQVCVDPSVVYVIQEDASAAFAITSVGLNADIAVAAGNTSTGTSGMEISTTSQATGSDLQLRMIGVNQTPDNEVGTHAKVLVIINEHTYSGARVGVT